MQQEDSEEDDKTQRIARSSSVHAPRLPVFPGMDHAVLKVSGAPGSCRCSPAPGRGILLRAAVLCGGGGRKNPTVPFWLLTAGWRREGTGGKGSSSAC